MSRACMIKLLIELLSSILEGYARSGFDPHQTQPATEECTAQSKVMIARIHRKISYPAATNNILTIKRRRCHDTAVALRRSRRLDVASLIVCGVERTCRSSLMRMSGSTIPVR